MKKYIWILLFILVIATMVFVPSCKRNSVDDPNMDGGAGFEYNISGTANPSTLYIPQYKPEVHSTITVRVLYNDGQPVVNGYVVFQNGCELGYFEGYKISDYRITNSDGIATIRFIIPKGTAAVGDTFNNIKATLSTDGRLDNPISTVYDIIPIHIIPYDHTEEVLISGTITFNNGTPIPGVVVLASNNGGVTVSQSSGSYSLYVPWGWTGSITPSLNGYSFVPTSYTYSNPFFSDLPGQDFIGSLTSKPTLQANPSSIAAGSGGVTGLTIVVTSSIPSIPISFLAVSTVGWITIDVPASGITPFTITINIAANGTGISRTGTIIINGQDNQGNASSVTVTVTQAG